MVTRKKKSSSGAGRKKQNKAHSASVKTGKTGEKKAGNTESKNTATEKNDVKSTVTVVLDPVITLAEVSDLKEKLLGHINAGEVKIDATQVGHIDTGGMQLLLSLSRAFKDQGKQIYWLGWSGACKHTAELLGLKKALEIKDN